MNVLKIKKLKENAIIPKRATEGSAGMDLYACIDSSVVINPGDLVTIPTGIAIQLSSGDFMANIMQEVDLVSNTVFVCQTVLVLWIVTTVVKFVSVFVMFLTNHTQLNLMRELLRWLLHLFL